MAGFPPNHDDLSFSKLPDLGNKWPMLMGLGILLMLGGILAIWLNVFTTLITVALLGVLLVTGGIFTIIQAIMCREWRGALVNILLGLLYIGSGAMLFANPAIGALSITMLIAAAFVLGGLFKIVAAIATRFEHWGWVLFSGLITMLLGVLVFIQWPVSGLFIIGIFVGIELISAATTFIALALAAKNLSKPHPQT